MAIHVKNGMSDTYCCKAEHGVRNGAGEVHKAKSKKYKSDVHSSATVAVVGAAAGSISAGGAVEGPAEGPGAGSAVVGAAATTGAAGAVPVEVASAVLSGSIRGFLGGLPRLPLGRFFLASIAASSSGVRTWYVE